MLIKTNTKVLRETNETHRGKLDKETNEKAIEVATLVILVLDEDIIIKAHTNVHRGMKENRDKKHQLVRDVVNVTLVHDYNSLKGGWNIEITKLMRWLKKLSMMALLPELDLSKHA